MVTVDGESVDWTTHSGDDENYAFMASNSSGSVTQVTSCSNECKESYANLKRLYDAQREELSDASVEIKAYTQGLKKVEAKLVAHQQAYQKRISKEQRQQRKRLSKKKKVQIESVSKQGRKNAKGDGKAKENAQSEGRTKEMMDEDKETDEVGLSTEDEVSTAKEKVSTDRPKLSTDDFKVSTDEQMESTDDQVDASEDIFKGTEDKGEGSEERVESTTEQRVSTDEQLTIEERAKFLHDTIAAQRKFLAHRQRSEAIRNRPPTKNQLRNQMMTYLKYVGNFKHSELKSKKFEDIQAKYEKIKRSDEDFIAIGSVEDDRLITKMNKKDSSKGEENTRKRKHSTRKKMKSRKRRFKQDTSQDDPSDTEKENEELRLCLTIATDEDKEVDYEILDKKYPIIDWKTESLGTKPQFDESKRLEEINLNVVTRSNGQKRYFSTLMTVLSVFDRAVYKLVMDIYQDKIPEGFDKVIWRDLIAMFNPDEQDEFWNSQHEWKVISWKLHSNSAPFPQGYHTLMTKKGFSSQFTC
ncbi:hypothetical protein Tco_1312502 [Tanacetum coccineum]